MTKLIDQAGVYRVDMGPNKGKFIAAIYDEKRELYAMFREDGKCFSMFNRDDMIFSKNSKIIHYVSEMNETIQEIEKAGFSLHADKGDAL